MDLEKIKNELYEIGKAYPTFLGLMQKKVGNDTVGSHWAKVIQSRKLDVAHFEDVCYEWAMMKRKMPDRQEDIIANIIYEVRKRMNRDWENLESHMKYHQTKLGSWLYSENSSVAKACKYLMENKNVSWEKTEALVAYAKGEGQAPSWLENNE